MNATNMIETWAVVMDAACVMSAGITPLFIDRNMAGRVADGMLATLKEVMTEEGFNPNLTELVRVCSVLVPEDQLVATASGPYLYEVLPPTKPHHITMRF